MSCETDERTGEPFTEATAWAFHKKVSARLSELGEITVVMAIGRYLRQHQRTEQGNKAKTVEDVELRLTKFFERMLKVRIRSLTAERCKRLYLGTYDDRGELVEHGAVTKPRKWSVTEANPEGKPRAAATHQNELKAAITFLDWCVEAEILSANPAKNVKLVGRRGRGKKQLNYEETLRFIDAGMKMAAEGDIGALCALLALVLAMRAQEVLRLVPRAIEMNFTVVKVLRGKTYRSERPLALPMDQPVGHFLQACLAQLSEGLASEDVIFLSETGKVRRNKFLWEATHRVCEAAGVTKVCTHGLRGTHLSLAEEAGATASLMLRSGGHSRAVQEAHYLKPGAVERGAGTRFQEALAKAAQVGLQVIEGGERKGPLPAESIQWRLRSRRTG